MGRGRFAVRRILRRRAARERRGRAPCSRSATPSNRSSASRAPTRSPSPGMQRAFRDARPRGQPRLRPRPAGRVVPLLRRACSKRSTPSSTPTPRATASRATISRQPPRVPHRRRRPGRAVAADDAARRTIPPIRGMRRSTMPARRARRVQLARAHRRRRQAHGSTAARSWNRAAVRSSPATS